MIATVATRASALLAVVVAVAAGAWASVSSGASAGPRESTPAQPTGELVLELIQPTFAIAADSPWRAVYTIEGTIPDLIPPTTTTTTTTTTSTAPGAAPGRRPRRTTTSTAPATTVSAAERLNAEIRVVLYRSIDERTELDEAVAGDPPNQIDSLDLPVDGALAAAGGASTLTVRAPTTTDSNVPNALSMRVPGLYPIGVELRVGDEVVAEHLTFVERLATDPPTSPPVRLGILAATADPGPAPTPSEIAAGRRDLAAIAEVASRAAGPVSVAVPPVLVSDLADDPDLAATLERALDGAELLPLPANQLDPSSAVAIDQADRFTRELREGEDILAAALPAARTSRSAWLVTSPISAAATAELRNLGFRLLVVDGDAYESLEGNIGGFHDHSLAAEVDVGDGFMMPALVVSPSGRLLDPEYLRTTGISPSEAAVQLLAEVLITKRDLGPEPRRSVVLATPDVGVPDADVAAALTTLADAVPDVELAPLSALPGSTDTMIVDGEPLTVTLPAAAGPDLAARAQQIALTRLSVESAASMIVDDSQADVWRAELDTLLSTGLDDATVEASLARISSAAAAVRDSVEAPPPFRFTLTGRESVLRLNLRNTADEPRRVVVRARSPKLTFPDGDEEVVLAPSGNTEVELRVVARSNGTSSVEVELLTPALGQVVAGPVVLTARVNALTGLGQVITGGAVLVLLTWWYGHFRRRRRRRNEPAASVDVVEPPPDVSPDAAEAIAVPHPDGEDRSSTPVVADRSRVPDP